MEWNSINSAPFQSFRKQAPDTCNIATTGAITCASTSGLAYSYSFSRQLSWIFSGTIPGDGPRPLVQVGRYSQPSSRTADISDVSTIVRGANNRPCCAPFPDTNFVKALFVMLSALRLVAGSKQASHAFDSATYIKTLRAVFLPHTRSLESRWKNCISRMRG